MKFPGFTHYLTGALVPVASLRSAHSCGVGEFADLPELGRWCRTVGLEVIQILPVNDTGGESSPYSALSAFALHPIYLRLSDIPEVAAHDDLLEQTAELRKRFEHEKRFPYDDVLAGKLEVLRAAYERARPALLTAVGVDGGAAGTPAAAVDALSDFVAENPWVKPYAVFRVLKDREQQRAWKDWTIWVEERNPSSQGIQELWNDPELRDELFFYVFLQWRLEEQLQAAAKELSEQGVFLKGDLPILMNEDSVDIWADREIFIPELRAGAPPDYFSETGQNWGFPIYDWDALARRDYDWWRRRLRQADKFYHAYRIDHVLGFFRIWAVPETQFTGILGHFYPSSLIASSSLHELGFGDDRIEWLARPHIRGAQLRSELGGHTDAAIEACLKQLDEEDLYVFRAEIGGRPAGEKPIAALELPEEVRERLLSYYRDRALVRVEEGRWAPTWTYRDCSRFADLSETERERFEYLVQQAAEENEEIWAENGRRLLGFMSETVDMLACAEDLGVIPRSVPKTLADLGMLSLKIPRWTRHWDVEGEPFVPPSEYPLLSVCAPSVHDTTTMREWWEREEDPPVVDAFWHELGFTEPRSAQYDPETARRVTEALLGTNSLICVLQLQDLLALDGDLQPDDAGAERVNIPGTYNGFNWTYRMPIELEALEARQGLNEELARVVTARAKRSIEK